MTRRLYYTDATSTEFTATVVAVRALEPLRAAVELDATLFYPTSGGQQHDVGELGDARVVDVLEEGDQRILHVVETSQPPPVGSLVVGRIDAARRRHHRQQHTGQHVLSRVLETTLGLPTVSSRLGETDNTIDLPAPAVDWTALDAAEEAANRAIWNALPVVVRFLESEHLEGSGLRKVPARTGTLRVIEVEGLDRSACGGTHVSNTAEIGLIAITGTERVRGSTRVHFLCGDRALAWRRACDRMVMRLAASLTTAPADLPDALARLQDEARAGARRALALARELLQVHVRAWQERAVPIGAPAGSLRLVAQVLPDELAPLGQEAAGWLVAVDRTVAALAWNEAGRAHVVVARHPAAPCDCRRVLEAALAKVGGKGGGSAERARGSAPGIDAASLLAAVAAGCGVRQEPPGSG